MRCREAKWLAQSQAWGCQNPGLSQSSSWAFNLAHYVTSAYVVFLLFRHLAKNSSSSNASSTLEVTFLFRILGYSFMYFYSSQSEATRRCLASLCGVSPLHCIFFLIVSWASILIFQHYCQYFQVVGTSYVSLKCSNILSTVASVLMRKHLRNICRAFGAGTVGGLAAPLPPSSS